MDLKRRIKMAYNYTSEADAMYYISNAITRSITEMLARGDDYKAYTVAALIKANELLLEKCYQKEDFIDGAITDLEKAIDEAERLEECRSESA